MSDKLSMNDMQEKLRNLGLRIIDGNRRLLWALNLGLEIPVSSDVGEIKLKFNEGNLTATDSNGHPLTPLKSVIEGECVAKELAPDPEVAQEEEPPSMKM